MIDCYEFYASQVISKPRYFEHFSVSLGTSFEIAGLNCSLVIKDYLKVLKLFPVRRPSLRMVWMEMDWNEF